MRRIAFSILYIAFASASFADQVPTLAESSGDQPTRLPIPGPVDELSTVPDPGPENEPSTTPAGAAVITAPVDTTTAAPFAAAAPEVVVEEYAIGQSLGFVEDQLTFEPYALRHSRGVYGPGIAKEAFAPFNPGASQVAGGSIRRPALEVPMVYSDGQYAYGVADRKSFVRPRGAVSIGLQFVTPSWSNDSFQTLVPPAVGANFPLLGDINANGSNFDLNPSFKYEYNLTPEGVDISFTADLLNLTGDLQQNVMSGSDVSSVIASNKITAVLATAPEVGFEFTNKRDTWFRYFLGGRYAQLDQNYDASITNDPSSSILHADQSFRGIGLVTGAETLIPILGLRKVGQSLKEKCPIDTGKPYRLQLYGMVAGNFVRGTNSRNSSLITVTPAGTTTDTVFEEVSEFIIIGEVEAGVEWSFESSLDEVWTVRTAFLGQLWTDSSLLDPRDTSLDTGDLRFMGLVVQAGVNW